VPGARVDVGSAARRRSINRSRRSVSRALNPSMLFLAALLALLAKAGASEANDLERQTLVHGGVLREYFVHFPTNRRPAVPRPTVFVLHGGGGADARTMASRTGMSVIADREDFVVVYPAGVDGQWNDGRGKTFRRGRDNTAIDDVGFIAKVIETLVRERHADPDRVYVLGLSNGGMMTYRLGIELGDRIAAIAAVIANLPENLSHARPVRALPVLIMNGTADPMMPWGGGEVRVLGRAYGAVLSTQATVRYWADAAHLPLRPTTQALEDRSIGDRCSVEVDVYARAGEATEVVLYRMQGGGHNLPGGNTPDRPRLLGPKCMDVNATEVIWSFLARFSSARPGTAMQTTQPPR
jgi:polyhydroxybutyrate depolymerase